MTIQVLAMCQTQNVCLTPSKQKCFSRVAAAITKNESASVVDVISCLCFLHYAAKRIGLNLSFWNQLNMLGGTDVIDYDFPWKDRIKGSDILDDTGKAMLTSIPRMVPCASNSVDRAHPKHSETTKTGKRLMIEKVYKYSGNESDGRRVYEVFYDCGPALQARIDELEEKKEEMETILEDVLREAKEAHAKRRVVKQASNDGQQM